ncbi:major facilitator superfamily domain-containing protein [Melampsora americana]|nr:major facilitator superfamily domain-containing protein [Melampsora americana]
MEINSNQRPIPIWLKLRSSSTFILIVVNLFLYGLIVPVLPFALNQLLGISDQETQPVISTLLAAHALAAVLFSPIAGLISDAGQGRLPFLFGLVAMSASTALLCFGRTIWILLVARILQGLSAAIVWTVGLSLVVDTVGPDKLGSALGSIYGVISVGSLASPTLGGIVYSRFGYYAVYELAGFILLIDIILRLLVIERSVAETYHPTDQEVSVTEQTSLLPRSPDRSHPQTTTTAHPILRSFPLLKILFHPRLLSSLFVTFTQASLLATFDATVPIHVKAIFGMDSLQSGLLFIAIQLPYLITGPIFGKWVDRSGARSPILFGSIVLIPTLILLRFPHETKEEEWWIQVMGYTSLLTFSGIGLSAIGGPSLVDASRTVCELHKSYPDLFGDKGPYGQLYAVNNVVFSLGMTIGPLISGGLVDQIDYGNSMGVMSLLCWISCLVAWFGMKDKDLMGRRKRDVVRIS